MSSSGPLFDTPYGCFELLRYPTRTHDPLRAWCSADALLLDAAKSLAIAGPHTLVVNDEHGALCVALNPATLWTDSYLAATATRRNLARNERPPVKVTWSTDLPQAGAVSVVMRVPKHLPLLRHQLLRLAWLLPEGTVLLSGGMDKHLSPVTAETLETLFGTTERYPGRHKARVFRSVLDNCKRELPAPAPHTYFCEALGARLGALPGVFSAQKLDIGTRFLLQHLDRLDPVDEAIDLACGNGVIGLVAHRMGLARRVAFCDESAMALASARDNWAGIFPDAENLCTFFHGDGLRDYPGPRPALVFCNPPFHSQHSVDAWVGQRLARQAARTLVRNGVLCVVVNRHLDYGPLLRKHFTRVSRLASNRKFIIWLAVT